MNNINTVTSARQLARLLPFTLGLSFAAFAQSTDSGDAVEEIVVTGTYIEGLSEETLPVTVMNEDAIKSLGAVNMQDILAYIPSISDFEFEDTNSGTNGARGDVAGVNMRGIGSGNTLVLINGRRMVVHPTFQAINSVPATFYNVNSIPSSAISRVEVLRDGASATYGADASAGVVNFITRKGQEGFNLSAKYGAGTSTNYDETEQARAAAGYSMVARRACSCLRPTMTALRYTSRSLASCITNWTAGNCRKFPSNGRETASCATIPRSRRMRGSVSAR